MDNWLVYGSSAVLILAAICALVFAVKLASMPKEEQLIKIQEWLLWAVTEAEKILGPGTGELKLRYVYDNFVLRFPAVSRILSFENFSEMVDLALDKMKEMLESNVAIRDYVGGQW